jgi:hypothetical protein
MIDDDRYYQKPAQKHLPSFPMITKRLLAGIKE